MANLKIYSALIKNDEDSQVKERPIILLKEFPGYIYFLKCTSNLNTKIPTIRIDYKSAGLIKPTLVEVKRYYKCKKDVLHQFRGELTTSDTRKILNYINSNDLKRYFLEHLLLESKKMQSTPVFNSIKDWLKWIKKKQKSPIINFNPNVGDMEVETSFFNDAIGNTSNGEISSGGEGVALGESLKESQGNGSKLIWYESNGNYYAREFLRSCSKEVRSTMARLIYKLEHNIQLNRNENESLQEGIIELRTESIDGWYRLTYFYPGDSTFVILSGFKKKSNKTPQNELQIAIQRKKDYLRRLKNGIAK